MTYKTLFQAYLSVVLPPLGHLDAFTIDYVKAVIQFEMESILVCLKSDYILKTLIFTKNFIYLFSFYSYNNLARLALFLI